MKYNIEFLDSERYAYHLIVEAESQEIAETRATRILQGCKITNIREEYSNE